MIDPCNRWFHMGSFTPYDQIFDPISPAGCTTCSAMCIFIEDAMIEFNRAWCQQYPCVSNYIYIYVLYHGPPKPTFLEDLEAFMVNNLVFRWPKPLFFMVLMNQRWIFLHCMALHGPTLHAQEKKVPQISWSSDDNHEGNFPIWNLLDIFMIPKLPH